MDQSIINREKLKIAIAKKQMSLSQMSSIFGLSRSTLSRKIAGSRDFKEQEIWKLVEVFGRSVLNLSIK